MSIVQTLAGAIVSSSGGVPTPTYQLYLGGSNNVNEGSAQTFNAAGTNIVNGTYYWTVETNAGDFATASGEFTITDNSGSFTVTPTADLTTEGAETFTVALRSGSITGPILATSDTVTINDTSLTPSVPPFSLYFPAGNPYLLVSNTQTDWALGTTYTIEFWSKSASSSSPSAIRTVMSQGPDSGKIDLGSMFGTTLFSNVQVSGIPEPTPAVWSHVAYVADGSGNTKVYYNGVFRGEIVAPGALSDGSSDLNIGRRAGINGQGYLGKLAMIRISTTAKYVANFSPSLSYGVAADTRLMLGSDTPLTDLALYQLNGVVPSNQNGNNLYFSKATYPNLNNQIRAGDTVTDTVNFGFISTIVAVTSADPDNWGVNVSPSLPYVTPVNFSGPGRHPISVQGDVTASTDFPSFQSLEFNNPQGDYLVTPASADWDLGTTWTIEFWIKANNSSLANINIPGGQWGLINQTGWFGGISNNSIIIGIAGGNLVIGQGTTYDAIEFAEPTAQVWTHVAVVNNGGGSAQKVYYNGVEQTKISGNYLNNGWTNITAPLYIGRLAPGYNSPFDGKMAMVRISNSAKYTEAFTATTTYNFETGTKLFLSKFTPTIDTVEHTITNTGVTTSTDLPQTFTGHLNPFSGGNLGATYSLFGDPNITAFSAIPVGARITSNLSGFGIRLVTGNGPFFGGQQITYDNTGLPGGTVSTTSDTYNFYW